LFSVVAFKTLTNKGGVATHLRRGGLFTDDIIKKLFQILIVKKSLKIDQYLMKAYKKCAKFLGHPVRKKSASEINSDNIEGMAML